MSKVSYIKDEPHSVDNAKVDNVGPSRRLDSSTMSLKDWVNMKTPGLLLSMSLTVVPELF
jgi:hypothetical protein